MTRLFTLFFLLQFSYSMLGQVSGDISLDSVYYVHNPYSTTGHYYSQIPWSQAKKDTIYLTGIISNLSSDTLSNAHLSNQFSTPYSQSIIYSDSVFLSPQQTDTITSSNPIVFSDSIGIYSWFVTVNTDSMDQNPTNNNSDSIFVNVTDTIYSRDRNSYGNFNFGNNTNFEFAVMYVIHDTVKATSISIKVGSNTQVGEPVSIYLYNANLSSPISSMEFVNLDTISIGHWVSIKIPEVILIPGIYYASLKSYTNEVFFEKSDIIAPNGTSFINLNSSGLWQPTSILPPIRLNISNNSWLCNLDVYALNTGSNKASAVVSNGLPPYSYLWNTGDTTETIILSQPPNFKYIVTVTDSNECTGSASVHIVGIPDFELNFLSIYPNPSNGIFQLCMKNFNPGKYMCRVKNLQGKLVYSKIIETTSFREKTIKLIGLKPGYYILEVTDSHELKSQIKLIIN